MKFPPINLWSIPKQLKDYQFSNKKTNISKNIKYFNNTKILNNIYSMRK